MLVDLVELFERGVRRQRDVVRASQPLRGELEIDRLWTHDQIDHAPVHANLRRAGGNTGAPLLEPLYSARIAYVRGRNIVLRGQQRAPIPGHRNREAAYEQIWWCKLVTGDPPARTAEPAARPSDAHQPGRKPLPAPA